MRTRVLGAAVIAGLLAVLGSSAAGAAGRTPPPLSVARWQQAIKGVRLPGHGCFTASYPLTRWRMTRCSVAPHHPYLADRGPRLPVRGSRPQIVGDGRDYSAEVTGGPLISVNGALSISPAAVTETGQQNGKGPQVANTFSLQMNSNLFPTAKCAGAAKPAICKGWQQFIYSTTFNDVFMQYWLIYYNAACPAGWRTDIIKTTTDCYINSKADVLSGPALTAPQLSTVAMTGSASATNGDSVQLTAQTANNTAESAAVSAPSLLGLAAQWTDVEFAVVGDCCSSQANFSAGTSLNVTTTTHNGFKTAPTCVFEGFTAETNNLNLASTPQIIGTPKSPTMISDQTSGPGTASCVAARGLGDTHLTTFGGLLYDFQASGDFELATTGPGFVVQNRQVSGAPAWPNAAVNQAIAAQVAGSDVAVCTAPTRLEVNGVPASLDSGGQLSLPGGGSVSLAGNTYLIQDASGNSVSATVNNGNPNWINAVVGLGRWPETVTGLLANAGGNTDAVAARGGTVLTAPFDFDQFYGSYAGSWLVSGSQDLLTACGSPPPSGTPQNVFYSGNLPSQLAQQARAICTADGVQEAALLDACTVDQAVLGDNAPDVYGTLPAGLTWGQINPPGDTPGIRR